ALGALAREHYQTADLELAVIGITGTNGKTTTSYVLEHIFRSRGFRTGVVGTVTHRWPGHVEQASMTTPDCLKLHELLSRMDKDGVEMVIMEVSSHALDQNRVAGIRFDAGVFLNLSQDHLDYHCDMEDYFQAKAKLFFSAGKPKKIKAVINTDDPYGHRLLKSLPEVMGFGLNHSVETALTGRIIKNSPKGIVMECASGDKEWTVCSPLCGRHNASNLLAAQGAALAMGLEPEDFAALNAAGQVPGRLEKIENQAGLDIYVDYAHTPDALENVCSSIKSMGFDHITVLFGCGGNRDKSKRPLMAGAVCRYARKVYLTSDNPRSEDPLDIMADIRPGLGSCVEVHEEPDRARAIYRAVMDMVPGEVLLVAGKGHEEYQEINQRKRFFSDADELRKALGMRNKKGC
ncbi:MAG: UDP-N-acetylmuramoyl-L-alanyl-D-glutamate--2,6-diaminopimelate ligase, partial [Desulfonatronovibrionaceae bacterium]